MDCPRCTTALEAAGLGGVELHRCGSCQGMLVAGNKFLPLLMAMAKLAPPPEEVAVPDDPGTAGPCASCGRATDHIGYLGQREVFIDRCMSCSHTWIDGDELEPLVVRYQISQGQRDEKQKASEQQAIESLAILRGQMKGQRFQTQMSSGYGGWLFAMLD